MERPLHLGGSFADPVVCKSKIVVGEHYGDE